jgi:hypothetical protein
MTDRPILFSGPMVRALLEGRKAQTRRVLRKQPHSDFDAWHLPEVSGPDWVQEHRIAEGFDAARLPYVLGDRLWVREAHAIVPRTAYRCSEGVEQVLRPDDDHDAAIFRCGWVRSAPRWRPGIHMPRWASRLTLTVTDVRVQRVQDITPEDARDEGVERRSKSVRQMWLFGADKAEREAIYLRACAWEYKQLWNSLNAKRGYGWDTNPWVTVITFTVEPHNIDEVRP